MNWKSFKNNPPIESCAVVAKDVMTGKYYLGTYVDNVLYLKTEDGLPFRRKRDNMGITDILYINLNEIK